MKEKLPKVYANKIEKKLNNNEKIYMSNKNIIQEEKKEEKISINKKISKIMNSKKHIYKIPVLIKTSEKEIRTTIIGKNSKNLITYDNELIKIENIQDIEIDEKKQDNQ